jgi:hypothetical protein
MIPGDFIVGNHQDMPGMTGRPFLEITANSATHSTYPVPLPYMVFFTALLYVARSVGLLIIYSVLYYFVKLLT